MVVGNAIHDLYRGDRHRDPLLPRCTGSGVATVDLTGFPRGKTVPPLHSIPRRNLSSTDDTNDARIDACTDGCLMIASTGIAAGLPLYITNPDDYIRLDKLLQVVPVARPRLRTRAGSDGWSTLCFTTTFTPSPPDPGTAPPPSRSPDPHPQPRQPR